MVDHFVWTADEQRLKEPSEVRADSLEPEAPYGQSLDDPEATYRQKQSQSYHGYVSNITETCHPENQTQLIIKVQTQPNVTDDEQMLVAALPDLIERTDVHELYTDGGYNGPALDDALAATAIEHFPSAIRGGRPAAGCLSLADFRWETHADGQPSALTCPQGQVIPVEPGRADQRFIARPNAEACAACPRLAVCPMRPPSGLWQGNQRTPVLYFNHRTFRVVQKRQRVATYSQAGNLRAAVEATVRSVKHPFRHGKVLVRGLFRVSCVILASAIMVNPRDVAGVCARRLHRLATHEQPDSAPFVPDSTVFGQISRFLTRSFRLWAGQSLHHSLKDCFTIRPLRLVGLVRCQIPTSR